MNEAQRAFLLGVMTGFALGLVASGVLLLAAMDCVGPECVRSVECADDGRVQ